MSLFVFGVPLYRCDGSSVAEAGYCSGTCYNVYVYMVILAVIKFIVSMTTIGNLIIDLRSVSCGRL